MSLKLQLVAATSNQHNLRILSRCHCRRQKNPRLEVVQVAIQKPGFFEEAGLLWAKLYHYPEI